MPVAHPSYYRREWFFNGLVSWDFKPSKNPNYLIATFNYIYEQRPGLIGRLLGKPNPPDKKRAAQFIGIATEWHTYPSFHSCHSDVSGWIYDKWCKWHYDKLPEK